MTGTYVSSSAASFVRIGPRRWRKVVVGKFSECPECGSLVEGRTGKALHIDWHELLADQLGDLNTEDDEQDGERIDADSGGNGARTEANSG